MPPAPKPLCALCHKALVAIGFKRKNGKPHRDWNGRLYHKQCYSKLTRAPRAPRKFRPKWR